VNSSSAARTTGTALITGASRGIGREVARTLASEGWQVLSGVRDPKSAPPGTQAEVADVADPDSIEALAERLRTRNQPLDALVNNAGVYNGPARRIWDVNVLGPLRLTRALEPLLAPNARVVMVTSGLGQLSAQAPSLVKRLSDPKEAAGDSGQRDKPRMGPHRYGRTQRAAFGGTRGGQRALGCEVAARGAKRWRVRRWRNEHRLKTALGKREGRVRADN
jgi:NAD(P)-dependent dehydrogenase (short-subunit alcohol dehydrogenase family)